MILNEGGNSAGLMRKPRASGDDPSFRNERCQYLR